ncbi:TolC family protein [Balneola sp. MJW-20]|uniref:TolC family protein n=1 Tax=Gracilimonas aurantiaca TaxID=3234185 RepID=UPI003464F2D9
MNRYRTTEISRPWGQLVSVSGLCLMVLLMFSPVVEGQSVAELQQEAAENNPELKARYQQYLAAMEQPQISGVLPDPEVSFSYFIKPIETRVGPQQARVSVKQMLPWFGSLGSQRSATELQARAAFESFQEARNRLFYQVEKTVTELYELEESIRLSRENAMILNSLVEISLARYETNRATQVDVLRAQIEEEDLQIQIELLENDRKVLNRKLNELLNRPGNEAADIPDTLLTEEIGSKQELLNSISRQNPDLSRLRYEEASKAEMRSLAKKNNRPDIMLGFDYIFTGESDLPNVANSGEDAIMVMAGLKVPIFGRKNRSGVRQAEQKVQEAEYRRQSMENVLETSLESSLSDYDDAISRYELYDQTQIQRIGQAIEIMMEAYASDRADFEEILRMQRKQLDYQLRRLQAKTDQYTAAAYIAYLIGKHNVKEIIEE